MKKKIISQAFENINPENEKFISKNLDITEQIYAILEKNEWTQKDLAAKLGKTDSEVSKLLSGFHNFTLRSLAKLEVALGEDIVITPKEAKEKLSPNVSIVVKMAATLNNKFPISQTGWFTDNSTTIKAKA